MSARQGESFVMNDEASLSFSSFVLGLASTALIHLGDTPDPETGKAMVNLAGARQTINVLEMLRVKTRGNLTAEEDRLISELLTDVRLRFVRHAG